MAILTTPEVPRNCCPSPCYAIGGRAYIMDDFGDLFHLDPYHATMDQWAGFVVDGIVNKH
jgi:hypothetical protein